MKDHNHPRVRAALLALHSPSLQEGLAIAFRSTIDQLLDGARTMRYDWKDLSPTEKTHGGSLVEIHVERQFRFSPGKVRLDFRIAGIDVDCKFSQKLNKWMIPPEAFNCLCLLLWADDQAGKWSAGLIRARRKWLNKGANRDLKTTLNRIGTLNIDWLFQREPLPPNLFMNLPLATVRYILDRSVSGQERVRRLFEKVHDRLVPRVAVETAATQLDAAKRVRGNGGARTLLRPLGIVIFGHTHRAHAAALGLPIPGETDYVATRLVPVALGKGRPTTKIRGRSWVRALAGDPVVRAPVL